MSVSYIRTKENFNNQQLVIEINTSVDIVPACLSMTTNGSELSIEFAAELSSQEELTLTSLVDSHIPSIEPFDVANLPLSDLDGKRLAVHSSAKPLIDETIYAVYTGRGDFDDSELLLFNMEPGMSSKSIDIEFDEAFGRVWIHEAYLKFQDGGPGDCISAEVVANGVQLQTSVNLDLVVDVDGNISYSPGGPGTGTHGFVDTKISLIPRTFSKDGDWDCNAAGGLIPNMEGTGGFTMNTQDTPIHRYVNQIPCFGSCNSYVGLQSTEAARLRANYKIQVTAFNVSNTTWTASCFLEVYRERTI